MGWFSDLFEWGADVGDVDQPSPEDVLARLPVDEVFPGEADELRRLARSNPHLLVATLEQRGRPKWAAAVRSSIEADENRERRHTQNIEQTARDTARDARTVVRRGPNWLVLGGLLAAVVLVTRGDR